MLQFNQSVAHMRGVQKVLQLVYKKEPQTFKHSVIVQYSLLQHQRSFANFLLSCLFLEKRTLSCPSNHASTTAAFRFPPRWYFRSL